MMKKNDTHTEHFIFHTARRWGHCLIWMALALMFQLKATGQTGDSGSPFTELGHAWYVPTSGIYYFNVGGTAFSTYVEAGSGWILTISGSGATSESSYPTTTSLTLQSDRILPVAVYTSTDVKAVRINATSGPAIPFDVMTGHAGVLANLQSNITLSHNNNGSMWTGSGTAHMSKILCGESVSLSSFIYHACNNQDGLHWAMSSNIEKVDYTSSGENDLNLWIRADPVEPQAQLPVELVAFNARQYPGQVSLSWRTATETDNAGFQVQRSADGVRWDVLAFVPGHGTTAEAQSYAFSDERPLPGMNYYRLRQVDFDGTEEMSKVLSVNFKNHPSSGFLRAFPNPATDQLHLQLPEAAFLIEVFDGTGQLALRRNAGEVTDATLHIGSLAPGLYLLRIQSQQGVQTLSFFKK